MKSIKCPVAGKWLALGVVVFSALCATLLAACGGNDESTLPTVHAGGSTADRSVSSVQLEGCVVDEFFIPRTGSSVRALSADGRLIGHATSDKDGLFKLQVPAQQTVSVALERPGGEALVVLTGGANLSVGGCLRDPHD